MMMEATMAKPMNTALATNIEIPLTITAKNQSKKNIYVAKILVNDEVLEGTLLSHDIIINGGEIVFEMSSIPDK
jgi:putative alpha-1,2-mannosidase